ncbi:MAG: hypothetical protein K9H16_03895 [Bacteroidales bacterium]|nr:hypothetical protein [Bacteroidales bacterium]
MSFLEKKIKDNTDFFDDQPIPDGHRKRFTDRLDKIQKQEIKSERWPNFMRIAAVLIILISGYFVIRNISLEKVGDAVLSGVTEISFGSEIENVFAYYDALSQQKIDEIDELAPNKTEAARIKQIAQAQLQDLDANLAKIEKEYAKYPENDRLKAALVNNKRKKAEIMDNILRQLDEAKSSEENQEINTSKITNP